MPAGSASPDEVTKVYCSPPVLSSHPGCLSVCTHYRHPEYPPEALSPHIGGHASLVHGGLHIFVNKAFMSGMLVDNDNAVAGLRDNIGFMHLGAGDA